MIGLDPDERGRNEASVPEQFRDARPAPAHDESSDDAWDALRDFHAVHERLAPAFVNQFNNWFTLVSAGFPALGTAVFGIRFQGDFGGSATRSQATSNTLRQIEDELNKDVTLARAADLTEQAARTMLIDLDEWRLVNQQQDLDIA